MNECEFDECLAYICEDILGTDFTKSDGLKFIQKNELFVKICPEITYC